MFEAVLACKVGGLVDKRPGCGSIRLLRSPLVHHHAIGMLRNSKDCDCAEKYGTVVRGREEEDLDARRVW